MSATIYKDLNQFGPKKKGFSTNAEAIYQSVYNYLTTRRRERLFKRDYGSVLEDELFEFADSTTRNSLLSILIAGLQDAEPRINIDKERSTVDVFPEEHKMEVVIVFSIIGVEGVFEIAEIIRR